MLTKEARWFGPGEIAKRLGVTSKTLRVYEREGLVTPHRTEAGWRAYGPIQVERLHLVLALRDLGLPLKRIGKLIGEKQTDLLTILTAQQESLEAQRRKITRGISLLSAARAKLAGGQALSLDDLIHLTKETLMKNPDVMKSLKSKFDAALEERLPSLQTEEAMAHLNQQISNTGKTKEELFAIFEQLMVDAREFMAKGDETSEAVKGLVRRWRGSFYGYTKPEKHIGEAIQDAFKVAVNDPSLSGDLPFDPAIFQFVAKVAKGMRDRGELT